MFLAFREMRRSVVRFALLVAAIGLLVFLILFQQALRDALITSFVGGIRNQSAPVLVYSVDAQRTLQGSVIPPPLEEQIRSADGVGQVAVVGQGTYTATVSEGEGEGEGPNEGGGDQIDVSVLGTDDQDLMRPTDLVEGEQASKPGQAVGSASDFAVGDVVHVVPAPGGEPVDIEVVGLARDVQLNVTATLFTDLATYEAAARATNPDATALLPNALAVEPEEGVTPEEVVASINGAAPDAEALTRADAAEKSPGVAQVRQSFQVIFLLYALVAPLVTGLFFLIVTLQKAGSLTLLRAIGAPAAALGRSLFVQVVIVIGLGLVVGTALYYPLTKAEVGTLALRFDPNAVAVWSVLLMVLGLVSAVVSLRRVLRLDPVEATGATGLR